MNSSIYGYLTVFHAIVSEGSIAGAARKLEVASPSVSNSLKLLEQHIGLPLFNRTTRKIELTEAGQRLYQNTQSAIQSLALAVENVQDMGETPSGLVRITVSRLGFLTVLQPHYAEFCRRYPDIQVEISLYDGTVDILKEGFDLGIRFGDKIEENMIARQLLPAFKEGLFASKRYEKQFGLPQKPEDLKVHKLVGYRFITANRILPLILSDNGEDITVEMPSQVTANDIDVMTDAIRQGLGIGRIFEPILQLQHDINEFVPVLKKYWKIYPPVYLYYLQHSQKAKRIRVLIDFLLEKMNG
ncbi:MAG TPA: LysR family transcriptional regulator [Pasteurellaceae bacterium]|nr:LysR family transcriptional regulator [Pasteurellaceae bacterium]